MKSAAIALAFAAAALLACGETPVERNDRPIEQDGAPQLTLSANSVVIDLGDGALLTATIRNPGGPAQYVSFQAGRFDNLGTAHVERTAVGRREWPRQQIGLDAAR